MNPCQGRGWLRNGSTYSKLPTLKKPTTPQPIRSNLFADTLLIFPILLRLLVHHRARASSAKPSPYSPQSSRPLFRLSSGPGNRDRGLGFQTCVERPAWFFSKLCEGGRSIGLGFAGFVGETLRGKSFEKNPVRFFFIDTFFQQKRFDFYGRWVCALDIHKA